VLLEPDVRDVLNLGPSLSTGLPVIGWPARFASHCANATGRHSALSKPQLDTIGRELQFAPLT
jgi:hypothetical protein